MNKKQLLIRAIKRSEAAYEIYVVRKKYHQALHIFRANEAIYQLLASYLEDCEEQELQTIFQYIFHLEDWFSQFSELQATSPKLEDTFVFNKLQDGIPYPKDLLSKLT
ncbi:hypothetical protein [Cloacibacterium normanense]|uniref:hypothetical protein n=1 Tax=Cloacibacterium normanense TaxID=237258 RepID=UPI0035AF36E7